MLSRLQYKCYFLLAVTLVFSINIYSVEKLVFSIDLIRHGDRNPIHDIPKSPIIWKGGLAALTPTGEEQEKQLGQHLRQVYVDQSHLLPQTYNPKTMYVRSTETKRTVESAKYLLQGLYPIESRGKYKQIKIDVIPQDQDGLKVKSGSKDDYDYNKKEWKNATAQLQDELEKWSQLTGMKLNNFSQLGHLADNLRIRRIHNRPFPQGISDQDADKIIALSERETIAKYHQKVTTQAAGEYYLKLVLEYIDAAEHQRTPLKYVLLSAHDATLMSVMNTLHIPFDTLPKYASRFNVSLFEDNHQYKIKMSFNDQPINLKACGGYVCTRQQIKSI